MIGTGLKSIYHVLVVQAFCFLFFARSNDALPYCISTHHICANTYGGVLWNAIGGEGGHDRIGVVLYYANCMYRVG